MSKNYIYAVATLIGTIIGAGIFSVPLVTSKAGLIPFYFLLAALVFIQYYLHQMYAEVVLSTKTEHRIPGYTEIYAGKKYKKIVSVICFLGGFGALLAYIILGGIFLHGLLGPFFGGTEFIYTMIMFSIGSIIVLFGIKTIACFEMFMTAFLLLVVALITLQSIGYIDVGNYTAINWKYSLLPYGLVFFSVGGQTAIPELCRLLKKEKKKLKSAIFWGTAIPAIITVIFVTVIVGVTGTKTSPDTLVGLKQVLPNGVIFFAMTFGFLSVMTSYLSYSQAVREIFWWDFKFNKYLAWVIASVIPAGLYVLGVHNLTKVVGITGSITGGMIGVIVIYLSFITQTKGQQRSVIKTGLKKGSALALACLFILGLLYSLIEAL
ncbi:amino acid permease [Candidatus Falkowbacteria bacterium]|nr:amino acid permease [Candidatus Falkowbacteria bacterium]